MIEILVVRDPDSSDGIRVWLDGVEVTYDQEVLVTAYVDAGAGWDFDDWTDSATSSRDAMVSPAAREAVMRAYADPPGKEYIDGWPEEDL